MSEEKSYYMALTIVHEMKLSRCCGDDIEEFVLRFDEVVENMTGMCPVYESREEAEERHPNARIVEVGRCADRDI